MLHFVDPLGVDHDKPLCKLEAFPKGFLCWKLSYVHSLELHTSQNNKYIPEQHIHPRSIAILINIWDYGKAN